MRVLFAERADADLVRLAHRPCQACGCRAKQTSPQNPRDVDLHHGNTSCSPHQSARLPRSRGCHGRRGPARGGQGLFDDLAIEAPATFAKGQEGLPTVLSLMGCPTAGEEEGRDASGLFTGATPAGWKDVAFMRSTARGPRGGWLAAVTRRGEEFPMDNVSVSGPEAD